MTCACPVPVPTRRPTEHWNPTQEITCWTCGGVIAPVRLRLRELSMPPITPLAESDPYAPSPARLPGDSHGD